MALTPKQRRELKARAHHLKPVVQLGEKGLSDAVVAEIELALDHHELIKVRLPALERETRDQLLAEIIKRTGAEAVGRIGHIATLYRKKTDEKS